MQNLRDIQNIINEWSMRLFVTWIDFKKSNKT